jgi:hypothetical protein
MEFGALRPGRMPAILALIGLLLGAVALPVRADVDKTRREVKAPETDPPAGRRGKRPWEVKPGKPGAPDPEGKTGPIHLKADSISARMDDDGKTRIVIAIGNVRIKSLDMTLEADNVVVWAQQAPQMADLFAGKARNVQVYAEGNVRAERGEMLVRTPRLFRDMSGDSALAYEARLRMFMTDEKIPVYVRAERMRQSGERWGWEQATISTCSFGHPHYEVFAGTINMKREGGHTKSVTANHAQVKVGKTPVFYFPSLSRPWKGSMLRSIEYQNSSQFGNGVLTEWSLLDGDWYEVFMELDYLSDRGVGWGVDLEYATERIVGLIDTYFIDDGGRDDLTEEREEEGTEPDDTDGNRYRIKWQHWQDLGDGWTAIGEYSYISDGDFLQEYFEDEAREGKEQETVIYLRKLYENFGMTFLTKYRVNDWQTQTEYLPQYAAHWIAEPIWKGRVFLTSDAEVAWLKRKLGDGSAERERRQEEDDGSEFDDAGPRNEDSPRTFRFDLNNRVFVPFKTGIFKVNPFVGLRETMYDKTAEGGGDNRVAPEIGITFSTDFWRIFDVSSDVLDLNGIRHVVTPTVGYYNRFESNVEPEDLYAFDEVDNVDEEQWFLFGVRQLMQTKRVVSERKGPDIWNPVASGRRFLGMDAVAEKEGVEGEDPNEPRIVDVAELDINFLYYPRPNRDNEGRQTSNVSTELRVSPMDGVSAFFETEVNTDEVNLDVVNLGLEVGVSERWSFMAGHRQVRDDNRNTYFEVNYIFNEKYSGAVRYSYNDDMRDKEKQEDDLEGKEDTEATDVEFILRRNFHTWLFEVSASTDEGDSGGRNNSLSVKFRPMGLEQRRASFAGEGRTRMGGRRAFSHYD